MLSIKLLQNIVEIRFLINGDGKYILCCRASVQLLRVQIYVRQNPFIRMPYLIVCYNYVRFTDKTVHKN